MLKIPALTLFFICVHRTFSLTDGGADIKILNSNATWLINDPLSFHGGNEKGVMQDVRNDRESMKKFVKLTDEALIRTEGHSDGEVVDAIEHYFWGMKNGTAIELGALDGSWNTHSMTFDYERSLNWRRILVEGNPSYKTDLIRHSPLALSVNAAICSTPSTLHYSQSKYVGGIVEFMSQDFMKGTHRDIYDLCVPPGNLTSLDFSRIPHMVTPVECIPMSHVLQVAKVKHVNYFILDVEVSISQSIRKAEFSAA